MKSRSRKVAPRKPASAAIVHVAVTPARVTSEAEARLEETIARLAELDAEHTALSETLAEFSERYDEKTGPAIDALFRAQRVDRRLDQLLTDLKAASMAPPRTGPRGKGRPRTKSKPAMPADWPARPPPSIVPEPELDLKSLYRRLARRLHPDAARDEPDRQRRSRLMMRLNAAFAGEDRVRLELLALEIEMDGGEGGLTEEPETVEAHAERRQKALVPLVERLERDLRRLRSTSTHRRFEEARRSEGTGQDYFSESKTATLANARALRESFLAKAKAVEAAARAVPPPAGASVLRSAVTVEDAENIAELWDHLEPGAWFAAEALLALAEATPWQAAWVVAAFFAEVAVRPPPGLSTLEAWGEWHEALRVRYGARAVPAFDEALTNLPSMVELGGVVHARGVRFGVVLKDPSHADGIAYAVGTAPLAAIATDVLVAAAPSARCPECARTVQIVHLHRLRDLDPLHALVCARCGAVVESYRAAGRPEGLEALAPYALATGLVAERAVDFGGTPLRLQMLARTRVTAGQLARHFAEVALDGIFDGTAAEAARTVRVRAGSRTLAASDVLPRGALTLSLTKAADLDEKRVIATLRARGKRRFGSRGR